MIAALALSYVTTVLRGRLVNGLSRAAVSPYLQDTLRVTTLPPDRVITGESEPTQLNLFLYLVTPNNTLARSSDLFASDHPWDTAGNGRDAPPTLPSLALDLHYLLTAYGVRSSEMEVLLGTAVQILQEQPRLEQADMLEAVRLFEKGEDQRLLEGFSATGVKDQIQGITFTPQFLDIEDLSKLYSALQARYRPSVAYKASVVVASEQRGALKGRKS